MNCPKCNSDIRDVGKFCESCGYDLTTKACPKCNTAYRGNSCTNCGYSKNESETPQSPIFELSSAPLKSKSTPINTKNGVQSFFMGLALFISIIFEGVGLFFIAGFFTLYSKPSDLEDSALFVILAFGLFFTIFSLVGIIKISKTLSRHRQAKINTGAWTIYNGSATHSGGLPIPIGRELVTEVYKDKTILRSGHVSYQILTSNLIDFEVVSESQVQYINKQSLTSMVAGGLLFGAVGAIIGGMPKSHKIVETADVIVITFYNSANEVDYIVLKNIRNGNDATSYSISAQRAVRLIKNRLPLERRENQTISL